MRISDWSSDVCSSDLALRRAFDAAYARAAVLGELFRGLARILRCFGHHGRLDVIELCETVNHARTFLQRYAATNEIELPRKGFSRTRDVRGAKLDALPDRDIVHASIAVIPLIDVDACRAQRIVGKVHGLEESADFIRIMIDRGLTIVYVKALLGKAEITCAKIVADRKSLLWGK